MLVVASLAQGCTGAGASSPSAELSGRLEDSGVTVVAALTTGPDGTRQLQATFTPQRTGYHLYSVDLPPGGVDGLGVPTTVRVGGNLRAAGSPAANVPVRTLRIEALDVNLPVYPDGPVTIAVPVRRTGNGRAEVTVTYAACSTSNCLAPVRDRVIALAPVGT
ncbi:protein-disulfide reductase DsbD domain-containing protein [Planotetraspora phitsanulokensis]|uniref:protein-disulfide reductase DsbD domain-containing protein n=1 Tax=Planotetraspora phitsanulokensis TaxID=575192 RepID=UPI0019513BB3|nr:protein-disulfide reductase DsbD domain-containing protein [Planotetraspora phitsanulokensis]